MKKEPKWRAAPRKPVTFCIKRSTFRQPFYVVIKARNGKTLLTSEVYQNRGSAYGLVDIVSVKGYDKVVDETVWPDGSRRYAAGDNVKN